MLNVNSIYFVEIKADDHPFIKHSEVRIKSSDKSKKNIIITGRNGFGKSTLLRAIKGHLQQKLGDHQNFDQFKAQKKRQVDNFNTKKKEFYSLESASSKNKLEFNNQCASIAQSGYLLDVEFNSPANAKHQYVLSYFEARRMTDLQKPNNITAPRLNKDAIGANTAGKKFLSHLVNRRSQLAFANEEGDKVEASYIRNWFKKLDGLFSLIFEKEVKLKFIRDQLDFVIEEVNGEIIDIKKLSDGYSSIIDIVTEIITRMEAISFGSLDIGGIVLIDEIETHLHVSLQKKILPFLNTMFPNIQFIVTTHSPFVLTSAKDAIIYDIATGTQLESEDEIWKYGYEDIVEGYFETDTHSDELEVKIDEYEKLLSTKGNHNIDDAKKLILLKSELEDSPTFKMPDIELRLRSLGLK